MPSLLFETSNLLLNLSLELLLAIRRLSCLLLAAALRRASLDVAVGLRVLALALARCRNLLGGAFDDRSAGVEGFELGLQSALETIHHALAGYDAAAVRARSGLRRNQ
jgi:hypothetical protein